MGYMELNHSSKKYEVIFEYMYAIVNLLCTRGAEEIILLFPVVKPRVEGEPPVALHRYITYRRMLAKLTDDSRVTLWRKPAMCLVKQETVTGIGGTTYQRAAIAPDASIIPIQRKFKFIPCEQRYHINPDCYDELAAAFEEEMKYHLRKPIKTERATGPAKILYDPNELFKPPLRMTEGGTAKTNVTNERRIKSKAFVPLPTIDENKPPSRASLNPNVTSAKEEAVGVNNMRIESDQSSTAENSPNSHHFPFEDVSFTSVETSTPSKILLKRGDAIPRCLSFNGGKTVKFSDSQNENIEHDDKTPRKFPHVDSIRVMALKKEAKSDEKPIEAVHSVDNANIDGENEIDSMIKQQIVDETCDDPTCVVPVRIGDEVYATQLDTGALPNVISQATADLWKAAHPRNLRYIRLRRPVNLRLADDKLIRTEASMMLITMSFADHLMRVPFYVIDSRCHTCIVGRLSMRILGIQPMLDEKVAYIQPKGEKHSTKLKFLDAEEFQNLTVFNCDVDKEHEQAASRKIIKNTSAVHWATLDPEDRDDGPAVFRRKLMRDLSQAQNEGRVTKAQTEEAYEELSKFSHIFSRYPGAYTGRKVKFEFKPGTENMKWRGEKYKPTKKLLPAMRKAVKLMLALGYVRPSKSTYINTLAPVVKSDGSIRVCEAPFDLNERLEDQYTEPPPIESILFNFADYEFLCSVDFVAGFWQMLLDESSCKYTAFQLDGQVYEFTRMPYGIKTSTAEFIEMINAVVPDEEGFAKFVDDLLVAGKNFKDMLEKMIRLFRRLEQFGLRLNPKKTNFFQKTTSHLGFTIAKNEIGKQSAKIEKFEDFRSKHMKNGKFYLKNVKEIQTMVGLTGLYQRFIPEYAQILAPIYKLTEKEVEFKWEDEHTAAAEKLYKAYRANFKLMPPLPDLDLNLETMATEDAMSSVLYQIVDKKEQIVMYTSHAFKKHQKKYTPFDREMQTLVSSIVKLQMWLHGRKIHVRKDLKQIVNKYTSMMNTHRKAAAWITQLNCFNLQYTLRPKKRLFSVQATELTLCSMDMTSLAPLRGKKCMEKEEAVIEALDNLAVHQHQDAACISIRKILAEEIPDNNKKRIVQQQLKRKKFKLMDNAKGQWTLYRTFEDDHTVPCMTSDLFRDTIDFLHVAYGHAGAAKLETVFRRMYFYPASLRYIKEICASCIVCKVNKNYAMRKVLEYAQIEAHAIGEILSADLFGPVACLENDPRYLLVVKDVFTSRVWIRPLVDIKKSTVTREMGEVVKEVEKDNIKIKKVITDNGSQFTSDSWHDMLQSHGIKIGHTTCYNPQSSLVERTMRIIGDKLRIKINGTYDPNRSHHGWHRYIDSIELEINNTPTPFGVKPHEAWGIVDQIAAKLPNSPKPFNFVLELKKLQEKETKNNVTSTTSAVLRTKKLDPEKDLIIDRDGYVRVTADGACSRNGKVDSKAGIGICFAPDSANNISEPIQHEKFPPSNNLAELTAVKIALEILLVNKVKKVKMFTDSSYVTKALNDTVKKWKENRWRNSKNKPVVHREIFEEILDFSDKFEAIEIRHVFARKHEFTNIIADQLAKKAVYTDDHRVKKIEDLTPRQVIEWYIRERRRLLRIREEYAFNKLHGDPTPLLPGDMVLITDHRQSSYDKGTSGKLYPKRYGPYIVIKQVAPNCYLLESSDDDKEERTVNIRQITLFLTKKQLEDFNSEPEYRSKFDNRTIEERVRDYLYRRPDENEDITSQGIGNTKVTQKSAEGVAKEVAVALRDERYHKRAARADDGAAPATSSAPMNIQQTVTPPPNTSKRETGKEKTKDSIGMDDVNLEKPKRRRGRPRKNVPDSETAPI